jgi:soluble lytic murein transglycosylase-like protein
MFRVLVATLSRFMLKNKTYLTALACAGLALLATAPHASADVGAERSLEAAALKVRYDVLLDQARTLEAAPEDHLLKERLATEHELRDGIDAMQGRVAEARQRAAEEAKFEADGGTINGVSLATLDAIAACESGGDPTAVNAAGYYGKYQFDLGTWASVGGSGNPAEVSEAEQDYRAALLYSRAGSSPWPVCGG